jgi:alkylation response protein AidB-like acyl-CoA dehydrogenase
MTAATTPNAGKLEGRIVADKLNSGASYMADFEICRLCAGARVTHIFAGSSQVMRAFIYLSNFEA